MKNILPVIISVFLSVSIFAQPVIQSTDLHTGMSFGLYPLNNVNPADLITGGANVTWNLSNATVGALEATVDFVDMASTGYTAQYPTANFAMKFTIGGAVKYNLWKISGTVWEEVAINVGTSGLQTFVNNRTDMVFPYSFNLSDTDTYQKTGQSASTVIHTYDAYGTLTLSSGSYTNLVRDHGVDAGAGTDQMIWWQTSPLTPILEVDANGPILWQVAGANGIDEAAAKNGFHVYPDPATSEIRILNEKPLARIEIYDIAGKLQLVTNQSDIDISNLSNGMYIIKAFSASDVESSKLIKQ